ncbi:MAG: tRNA lysidine(34) synthetase TilS [Spirochaetales bacterium]|nr:tRNA lysidine(34) synthetase TilS [Exilispira sp.]NMC66790.1 tRNA lysidine(34) synthetase TilS [Spirochaetales bacterium]
MKFLEDQVFLFLNKYIQDFPNTSITVALSMGSDSMALFYILLKLKKKYGFDLSACHLNHGIREESDLEQKAFIELMNQVGIQYYTDNLKIPNEIKKSNKSFELWARNERLKFYERAKEILKSDYIATAHNKDDIIETFFLNLFRGTGLVGASSIKPMRSYLIRPVIEISKKELKEYLIYNNIKFFEDKTNSDNKINRNYIRNIVIENIYNRFTNSSKSIFNFIKEINSTLDFIDSFIPDWFFNNYWNVEDFLTLQDYLQSHFLYKKIKELCSANLYDFSLLNLSKKTIEVALKKIKTIKNGYIEKFPKFDIFLSYGNLYFIEKKYSIKNKVEIDIEELSSVEFTTLLFGDFEIKIKIGDNLNNSFIKGILKENFIIRKELCGEKLVFSKWEEGDRIKLAGYHKKLHDIFVDWKIPRPLREKIIVIRNYKEVIGFYIPFNSSNRENYILSKDYFVDFNEKFSYILLKIEKI